MSVSRDDEKVIRPWENGDDIHELGEEKTVEVIRLRSVCSSEDGLGQVDSAHPRNDTRYHRYSQQKDPSSSQRGSPLYESRYQHRPRLRQYRHRDSLTVNEATVTRIEGARRRNDK